MADFDFSAALAATLNYTPARLLYRLHKITADQVWAYTESDPPKITEDEALAICGPRAKDETAGS